MIRKAFKVGDTVTIKRIANTGTGYHYALTGLNGGVALIDTTTESGTAPGAESVQSFTFQFLYPGLVEIRFVQYREAKELIDEDTFTYIVNSTENNKTTTGGWSEYEPLTEHDKEIFNFCVNFQGIDYIPMLVSRQIVNGSKNHIFCITKTVTQEPQFAFAIVTIFIPQEGDPVLESIIEY